MSVCLSVCICVCPFSVSVYVASVSVLVWEFQMQCGAIRMAAELVKKGGDKKASSCGTREKAKGALRRQPVPDHSHGGAPS